MLPIRYVCRFQTPLQTSLMTNVRTNAIAVRKKQQQQQQSAAEIVLDTTNNTATSSSPSPLPFPLDGRLSSIWRRHQKERSSKQGEMIRFRQHNTCNLLLISVPADEWTQMKSKRLLSDYFQLSKSRLTLLITATALGGYMMAPASSFGFTSFMACAIGTALLSAAANSCNHLLEAPYDAQMKRTQSRLLVAHRFSSLHATAFACATSSMGFTVLWLGCNQLTAALGLLNVFLYAGVYTPMKRHSIACTWIGAIVGSIPPLMGYTAAVGTIEPAAFALAAILYSWQFPHFNALSWNLRNDYCRAGYRVMCSTDEALCRRTTLRYSLGLFGICSLVAPWSNLTTWTFALDSLPLNVCLLYLAVKFYTHPDSKTSRLLFRYTLLYSPLTMILMIVGKYGQVPSKHTTVQHSQYQDIAKSHS